MPIKRSEHKENFTQILNELLNDSRLSYGARGLMAHVLTHYDDWNFTGEDYFITETDKKVKIRSYLKELIKFGYLKRYRETDLKGRLGNSIYIFYEIPNFDYPNLENQKMGKSKEFSQVKPNLENPILEKPNLENQKQVQDKENSEVNPNVEKPNLDLPNLDCPNLENRTLNNTNINNTKIYSANDIENLWSLYTNKKGKAIAIKRIPKLLQKYGKEQLERCITRYSNEIEGKDKQYILNGSTFFNGRYEDYLDCNYKEIKQTVQAKRIIEEDYIQT